MKKGLLEWIDITRRNTTLPSSGLQKYLETPRTAVERKVCGRQGQWAAVDYRWSAVVHQAGIAFRRWYHKVGF